MRLFRKGSSSNAGWLFVALTLLLVIGSGCKSNSTSGDDDAVDRPEVEVPAEIDQVDRICEDESCGEVVDEQIDEIVEIQPVACIQVPPELNFGAVVMGGSVTKTLPILSTCTAELAITEIKFDRSTSAEFKLLTDVSAGLTIAPEQSANIEIEYAPVDEGADAGVLLIVSNNETGTLTEVDLVSELKGTPDITVEPDPTLGLDFGPVPVAGGEAALSVAISNTLLADGGNRVLHLDAVKLADPSNPDFRVVLPMETTLPVSSETLVPTPPGAPYEVQVICDPT